MAKSKSFFTLRKGSTKSLTLSTLHGQQITKDRVRQGHISYTDKVMDARMRLSIVSQARTQLRGLVNHSFQGLPYGDRSLRQFSKLNLDGGRLNVYQYPPKGLPSTYLATLLVSDGSLPPCKITLKQQGPDKYQTIKGIYDAFGSSNIGTTITLSWEGDLTYEKIITTLSEFNLSELMSAALNINQKEQMSVLFQHQVGEATLDVDGSTYIMPTYGFQLARLSPSTTGWEFDEDHFELGGDEINIAIKCKGTNVILMKTFGFSVDEEQKKINLKVLRYNNSYPDTEIALYSDGRQTGIDKDYGYFTSLAGIILSKQDDTGNWLRSRCTLAPLDENEWINLHDAYPTLPATLIRQTYIGNNVSSGSSKFLNNGPDSTGISGNSGKNAAKNTTNDTETD